MNNFKYISALLLIIHSSSSLRSVAISPSDPLSQVSDKFAQTAIKYRGKFDFASDEEREHMKGDCQRRQKRAFALLGDAAHTWESLTHGLEEDSLSRRVMRTCEELPEVLTNMPLCISQEMGTWTERLKFLAAGTEPHPAAYLPFSIQTDGELLRSEDFKKKLQILRAALVTLGNFLSDLAEISETGILTKLDIKKSQGAIAKFEENIENFGHNSTDALIEKEALDALIHIRNIISGTYKFSGSIINFCEKYSPDMENLDKTSRVLRKIYLNHFQTLRYLSPTLDTEYYLGILDRLPRIKFAEVVSRILEKYRAPHEELGEMDKKIALLLKRANADKDESPRREERNPIRRKDSKRDLLKHPAESATLVMARFKEFFSRHHRDPGTRKHHHLKKGDRKNLQ